MISTDMQLLHLKHKLDSPLEKSLIERVMQYSRIELSFDDYYPCNNKQNCDLEHIYNWIKIFDAYNTAITTNKIQFLVEGGQLSLN